jgi:membrane fusion protein (multidrug efflux system)
VWVLNGEGKPEQRIVEVGDWHDADWFITQGLRAGERIVVDGALRVAPGAPLNIVDNSVAAPPSAAVAAERPKAASLPVQKDPLKADLPGNESRRQP